MREVLMRHSPQKECNGGIMDVVWHKGGAINMFLTRLDNKPGNFTHRTCMLQTI